MANVSFPLSMDDGEMRCWKTFRPDTSNSDSHCTVGYEYSHGRCYVPCRGGYKAWGQFCFAASDAQSEVKSYQRDLAPSEQQGVSTELISKLGQCPSAIPFDCKYTHVICNILRLILYRRSNLRR
jgi:hypothetical protein